MIPESVFAHSLRELLEPVRTFLDDPTVSEVLINGPERVFVERRGKLVRTAAHFGGERQLLAAMRVIAQYAGRPFDTDNPILEARMPDGSRVEAVLGPLAKGGVHVAIRRFSQDRLSVEALLQSGSLTDDAVKCLDVLVQTKHNVVVAGGTGTGKTSLLNVLTGFVPEGERVIVIEDARELQPRGEHVVQLECRPADDRGQGGVDVRALFKAALRMRPDRLVVGEVRDGSALDLLQAMTSGHGGCLSTLHASHPRDALSRLETMALMADVELPLRVLRSQIASGIDVIVQADRLRDGARVVTHITALQGLDGGGDYLVEDLFVRAPGGGALLPTGALPRRWAYVAGQGLAFPAAMTRPPVEGSKA